jgi:hypothetical protein
MKKKNEIYYTQDKWDQSPFNLKVNPNNIDNWEARGKPNLWVLMNSYPELNIKIYADMGHGKTMMQINNEKIIDKESIHSKDYKYVTFDSTYDMVAEPYQLYSLIENKKEILNSVHDGYSFADQMDNQIAKLLKENPINNKNQSAWLALTRTLESTCNLIKMNIMSINERKEPM